MDQATIQRQRVNQETIHWIEGTPLGAEVYSIVSFPPHMHENVLEIVYCLQGECTITIAADEVHIKEGVFLSIDRDAYYFSNGQDCICASIYIDLDRYKEKFPQLEHILFLCDGVNKKNYFGSSDRLRGIILSTLKYLLDNDRPDPAEITAITERFLDFLIHHFDILFSDNNYGQVINDITIERYNRMNAYMAKHLTDKISISDVAGELNLTPGYVSELCCRYSIGFRNMISYRRVNMAEKYLLTTDYTIAQIAEECGFSDTKYFYRAFRKWHFCGPKQFRQLYREQMYVDDKGVILNQEEIRPLIDRAISKHYDEMFFSELLPRESKE